MNQHLPDETVQQIINKLDSQAQLRRTWALVGGVSAQVTAAEFEQADGQLQRVVIRQHGAADLAHNPHVARDEYQLLHVLYTGGMSVPRPLFADESGAILPSPYVVIAFIEGETLFAADDLSSYIAQAAAQLAKLHSTHWQGISFLPASAYATWFQERPTTLDDSLQEGHIRDVLEAAWPLPAINPVSLLHGDYWPGNLMWKAGKLAAVIDWEDAHLGDPLEDVAITRLEMLWAFGQEAMEQFTRTYQTLASLDDRNLPYWDLCAALRPAGKLSSWITDSTVRHSLREKHHVFVEQAISKISSNSSR
ncbi:MAG: phosphotransferase [Chloroflexi bacterium]|nr:phosphotransferase [Chloroflexota bacterium]MCC6893005.1 phosphotransferase [Anaerolineae bacterium]